MKNTPIAEHASAEDGPRLPPAWRDALALFDRDLRTRGASERTRRAYGVDLGQLAGWAGSQGLTPHDVDYKVLRRYAAVLSNRRVAATTLARKRAPMLEFSRPLVEAGGMAATPAELMPPPRRPAPLLKALKAADIGE